MDWIEEMKSRQFGLILLSALCFLIPAQGEEEKKSPDRPDVAASEEGAGLKLPERLRESGCTIFMRLVEAAGMTETLQETGPLTCFVPNDEVFEALPEGSVEKLLLPANKEKLAKWLSYLVLKGDLTMEKLMLSRRLATVGDEIITVWFMNGEMTLNEGVKLTRTDIRAANGVVHTIDRLMVAPPAPPKPGE